LAEVELVFGFWGLLFLVIAGRRALDGVHFAEPLFVAVAMMICATKPVVRVASVLVSGVSRLLPLPPALAFYLSALILGPLLGSFITEPAAMTVTAILLSQRFFCHELSPRFQYATLGLLFVNVSVGGVLTHFAAPPVVMVARTWNWDLEFMLAHFGWRGALTVTVATVATAVVFRRELLQLKWESGEPRRPHVWRWQDGVKVGIFLAGLTLLGTPQRWWLEPLLDDTGLSSIFFGSAALTSIIDNAALTYLGAQVPTLSDPAKFALVAGAVTGGGLTVIANAPNPAGIAILNRFFKDGVSPLGLFLGAFPATSIAAICFWII
jgi:hypothetical protein